MKTNKKHFEYFKKRCQHWIDFFGLKQWDIEIYHGTQEKGNLAEFTRDYKNKIASIYLNKNWKEFSDKINKESLNKAAFHEVVEVLLCPLRDLAEDRAWDYAEFDRSIHEVIRTLENVVLYRR